MQAAEWIGTPDALFDFVIRTTTLLPALATIAELRVADHIGDEPVPVRDLAQACGAKEDSLRRVLYFLGSEGLLRVTDDDRVGHTDFSRRLRSDHPVSVQPLLLCRDICFECRLALPEGVRTGAIPYDLQLGKGVFDYHAEHPDIAAAFARTMTTTTRITEDAIFAAHRFRPFRRAVDVGGSHGTLVRRLLAEYPGAEGVLFDLPEVVQGVEAQWAGSADSARLSAVGGSFFEAVPAGADLYLLKQIIHDWDDESCVRILNNIRAGIAPHGRLAVFDIVLPEQVVPHPGWAMDMNMLACTSGRERRRSEFAALFDAAGFTLESVTPTASAITVLEAVPV